MAVKEIAGIKLPPIEQVGIVVKDVDQAIEKRLPQWKLSVKND